LAQVVAVAVERPGLRALTQAVVVAAAVSQPHSTFR
jgi:hypothetical protein